MKINKKVIFVTVISLFLITAGIGKSEEKAVADNQEKLKKDQQERAELLEYRTLNSKHYKNPDGTRTAVIYSSPVHYQDRQGGWREMI